MSKTIKMINNHVLFQFEQEGLNVNDGKNTSQAFQERTDWGFEFYDFNESTKKPRWGQVKAIGPDVDKNIKIGMRVLIDTLKWTNHVVVDGEKYWRTDSNCILAYNSDDSN